MKDTRIQSTPTAFGGGSKFRNDLILIAVLIAAAIALGLGLLLLRPRGNTVEVRVDGELVAEYSLSRDIRVEIEGIGGVNILVIRDGMASVEYADCPDKICAAHSPIYRSGESIACLPHRVIVTVSEKEDAGNVTSDDVPDIIV